MNPSEYQKLAARTECAQSKALMRICMEVPSPEDFQQVPNQNYWLLPTRALHAVLGITSESGEIAALLEKWLYYGKYDKEVNGLTGLQHTKEGVADEAGDLLWYVAQLLNTFGLDMDKVMEANIEKLKVRYPDKYTDYNAEHRDRAAEGVAQQKICLEKYHDCSDEHKLRDGLEGVE